MKVYLLLILSLFTIFSYGQKDSLDIGDTYFEDQLYLDISYNVLFNQPESISPSSFSFGIAFGYIRDIPFNSKGTVALGVGLGYGYDSFNHGLKPLINDSLTSFDLPDLRISNNSFSSHNIDLPIQVRIRNSDVNIYNFWRLYVGIKQSYNFSNQFRYLENDVSVRYNNLSYYNKWQTGLTFSGGYGTFNFYFYYGLTPIFKNAVLFNGTPIQTKMYKIGLSFYLL